MWMDLLLIGIAIAPLVWGRQFDGVETGAGAHWELEDEEVVALDA